MKRVTNRKRAGVVIFPNLLYAIDVVSGEYVWWTGRYQSRVVYFVTRPGAEPCASPSAWWVSKDAAIEAEKAPTYLLPTMDHLRASVLDNPNSLPARFSPITQGARP